MDWVAEGIAIGGRREALDTAQLQQASIEAVLQLHGPDEEPTEFPFAKEVLHLAVVDGAPLPRTVLLQGVRFIEEQRRHGRFVLVTCGAGISRSATFVAAYLHEQGADLLHALKSIMIRRPQILPHPELLTSLIAYYQIETTTQALLIELVKVREEIKRAPSTSPPGNAMQGRQADAPPDGDPTERAILP